MLRIFGSKKKETTGEWGKIHNRELHILCLSSNNIAMIKSKRMRWAGHVSRMDMRNAFKVLVRNLKGKDHLEDGVDEIMLLK